jgi:hypothetical protein
MDFRTIVEPKKSNHAINHESLILMMGSCFAENIGEKLLELKFSADVNPFGVLFNPVSVAKSLERLNENKLYAENELFYHNDCWHSFTHHSRFSMPNKTECLELINNRLINASKVLKNANFLVLTFGTAYIFYKIEDGEPVANCHKLPAKKFNRKLLDVDSIVSVYKKLFDALKENNPKLKIILTVSPVRHLGDGVHENQISKSVLLLAVNELCKSGYAEYFPAYEIVLDDLRDYRFYKTDMAHPSDEAVNYIFEKFGKTYFSEETKKLNVEIESINNAFNHRPINDQSELHKQFCQQTINRIQLLLKRFPFLNFSIELNYFQKFV